MLKTKIIEIGREIIQTGLVAGTWGNISAWDDSRDGFWITPSGMDYLALKEEDLVLMNMQGVVLEGYRKPSSEEQLHRAIYSQRQEVKGIVHTHSIYATAHAVAHVPLPGLVEDFAMIVGEEVSVADYQRAGTEELAEATVRSLADKNAVFLANHGLVGVGRSVEEALKVCQIVEKSAQIHIMSRLLGTPVQLSDEDKRGLRSDYINQYGQRD
ncbi:class II aldolase/adducin family protein [Desulfitobacterium metallireducens]|uniref:Aldolase n=1 Tax=Desulfitobacterium metallireducens DSM 15288 TaxID=871968 RepID=W0EEU6_9FIRM|nr:class II aldolase/adducin family protein [Desulfitobacterium metallireducens]AHF07601.1 aldolase [Desulfitobacterium metallireducens DSM 15288]